tara:strand:+ start:408 stop:572 length:165 start_codon:yes stop_codon:yes gene_type:complete
MKPNVRWRVFRAEKNDGLFLIVMARDKISALKKARKIASLEKSAYAVKFWEASK